MSQTKKQSKLTTALNAAIKTVVEAKIQLSVDLTERLRECSATDAEIAALRAEYDENTAWAVSTEVLLQRRLQESLKADRLALESSKAVAAMNGKVA